MRVITRLAPIGRPAGMHHPHQKANRMSEIVFDALEFASQWHRGAYRKGTNIPYIVHPMSMVRYLARLDAPDELVAAAALHDLVEDTEATLQDIKHRFGPRIAALVEGASEKDKSLGWRERKVLTIDHARATDDIELVVLKCVDKLDNLRDMREDLSLRGEAVWERFNADQASQAWYNRTLAKIFSDKLAGTPYHCLAVEMTEVCERVFGPEP